MSSIADNFTEKFLIDVEKFAVWIIDNSTYKISNSDNGENFNNNSLIDLFKDFKEPGRYKMDVFIKHLSQTFPIFKNDNKIESHDIKQIVDDFKNNKPKRVPKIFKKTLSEPKSKSEIETVSKSETVSETKIETPSESEILLENKIANMPIEYDFLTNKNFIVNLEDIVFDII